ncbi:hypothetical protein FBU30_007021 [Linnemannia zychae]|nr:hypothetical protein FBU30_007021 [Linnemannia zychae]
MTEPIVPSTTASSSGGTLHRSTAGRMTEVSRRLNEQDKVNELEDMKRAYHKHYLSKRPLPAPGVKFVHPDNFTSRQARHLDNTVRRIYEKRKADEVEGLEDDEFVPIRVKVDFKISKHDLAKAFVFLQGLTFHPSNFFGQDHAENRPPDASEENRPHDR